MTTNKNEFWEIAVSDSEAIYFTKSAIKIFLTFPSPSGFRINSTNFCLNDDVASGQSSVVFYRVAEIHNFMLSFM